jgi:hypothetical protein
MIAAVCRTAGVIALTAVALVYVFVPGARMPSAQHRLLDPNDPIAADGSQIAGRAHTIFDTEAYGAFKPEPRADSDDPADFEPVIKLDRAWAEISRAQFKSLLHHRLDASLCQDAIHQQLTWAVRHYYENRGREKHNFSVRGPRATAAIEAEWSTPADREIDDYVRHVLQYGLIHKADFPAKTYPEFAKTFADAEEFGAGCTGANR